MCVVGEIDLATAPLLRDELDRVTTEAPAVLVVDTRRVPFIDSAGVAALVRAHQQLERTGGQLRLGAMSDAARRIFEITGLLEHFGRPEKGNGGK